MPIKSSYLSPPQERRRSQTMESDDSAYHSNSGTPLALTPQSARRVTTRNSESMKLKIDDAVKIACINHVYSRSVITNLQEYSVIFLLELLKSPYLRTTSSDSVKLIYHETNFLEYYADLFNYLQMRLENKKNHIFIESLSLSRIKAKLNSSQPDIKRQIKKAYFEGKDVMEADYEKISLLWEVDEYLNTLDLLETSVKSRLEGKYLQLLQNKQNSLFEKYSEVLRQKAKLLFAKQESSDEESRLRQTNLTYHSQAKFQAHMLRVYAWIKNFIDPLLKEIADTSEKLKKYQEPFELEKNSIEELNQAIAQLEQQKLKLVGNTQQLPTLLDQDVISEDDVKASLAEQKIQVSKMNLAIKELQLRRQKKIDRSEAYEPYISECNKNLQRLFQCFAERKHYLESTFSVNYDNVKAQATTDVGALQHEHHNTLSNYQASKNDLTRASELKSQREREWQSFLQSETAKISAMQEQFARFAQNFPTDQLETTLKQALLVQIRMVRDRILSIRRKVKQQGFLTDSYLDDLNVPVQGLASPKPLIPCNSASNMAAIKQAFSNLVLLMTDLFPESRQKLQQKNQAYQTIINDINEFIKYHKNTYSELNKLLNTIETYEKLIVDEQKKYFWQRNDALISWRKEKLVDNQKAYNKLKFEYDARYSAFRKALIEKCQLYSVISEQQFTRTEHGVNYLNKIRQQLVLAISDNNAQLMGEF